MTTETDRLRNLLADERGEPSGAAVSRRLAELDDLLPDADADSTAEDLEVLSVLGTETRYRIVRLLTAADDELTVAEFEPLLDVTQSAISHALSTLADADLVERRKEGKWRYYRPTPLAERLLDALDAGREGED